MAGELQRALAVNLLAERERRGLNQESFGDVAGIHRTYVSGIEQRRRNITLLTLERIAVNLGLDPLELLRLPPD